MPPDGPVEVPDEAITALQALREAIEPVIPQQLLFGVGIKQVGGEFLDELALVVLLEDKLPAEQVPPDQLIPPDFAGFRTDVQQFRPTEIIDSDVHQPLLGGIQISRPAEVDAQGNLVQHPGTLGAIVRSRFTRERMLLTAQHVLPTPGASVHQPGDLVTGHRVVGRTGAGVNNSLSWLDCAVAALATGQGTMPFVAGIGQVRGTAAVRLWEPVKKRGYRTELTTGRVFYLAIDTTTRAVQGMRIDTVPAGGVFRWLGDSGSAVLNARDEVVGLLFAMNDNETDFAGTPLRATGVASTIGPVQDALGIDVAVAPGITSISPDTAAGALASFGQVTITGWGFEVSSPVTFGGTPTLTTRFDSTQQLVVTPPPLLLSGTVDVLVQNSFGEASEPGPAARFTF